MNQTRPSRFGGNVKLKTTTGEVKNLKEKLLGRALSSMDLKNCCGSVTVEVCEADNKTVAKVVCGVPYMLGNTALGCKAVQQGLEPLIIGKSVDICVSGKDLKAASNPFDIPCLAPYNTWTILEANSKPFTSISDLLVPYKGTPPDDTPFYFKMQKPYVSHAVCYTSPEGYCCTDITLNAKAPPDTSVTLTARGRIPSSYILGFAPFEVICGTELEGRMFRFIAERKRPPCEMCVARHRFKIPTKRYSGTRRDSSGSQSDPKHTTIEIIFSQHGPMSFAGMMRCLSDAFENTIATLPPGTIVFPRKIQWSASNGRITRVWRDKIPELIPVNGALSNIEFVFITPNAPADPKNDSSQWDTLKDRIGANSVVDIKGCVSPTLEVATGGLRTARRRRLGVLLERDSSKRTIREQDVLGVKKVFDSIDSDKSGFLSLKELISFSAARPRAVPNTVFKYIVAEGDKVGFLELLHCHFPKCTLAAVQNAAEQWCPKPVVDQPPPMSSEIANAIGEVFQSFKPCNGRLTPSMIRSSHPSCELSDSELQSFCSDAGSISLGDFVSGLGPSFSSPEHMMPLSVITHRTHKSGSITWTKLFPCGSADRLLDSPYNPDCGIPL
eukprot:TRINITY_DN24375_c0_g1_i1.p1 TRINITY_DN24375_c0_g1~~TRINITY_DN24375_c0_g1_i1.p1  ORF type:complete len:625 (+),score=80.52 TRINITY_DN24375_c0_g1_i1:40-1875(+)